MGKGQEGIAREGQNQKKREDEKKMVEIGRERDEMKDQVDMMNVTMKKKLEMLKVDLRKLTADKHQLEEELGEMKARVRIQSEQITVLQRKLTSERREAVSCKLLHSQLSQTLSTIRVRRETGDESWRRQADVLLGKCWEHSESLLVVMGELQSQVLGRQCTGGEERRESTPAAAPQSSSLLLSSRLSDAFCRCSELVVQFASRRISCQEFCDELKKVACCQSCRFISLKEFPTGATLSSHIAPSSPFLPLPSSLFFPSSLSSLPPPLISVCLS